LIMETSALRMAENGAQF